MFMFAIIFKTFGGLIKIYTMMTFPKKLMYVEFVKLFVIDAMTLAWVSYGTAMFQSPLNDCGKVKGT